MAWYWYGLAAAGIVGLLAAYGAAYARALRPRAGTLEWIERCDRPALSMAGRRFPLRRADAMPLLAVLLAAAALWGGLLFWSLGGGLGVVPRGERIEVVLDDLVLPVLAAGASYLLFRQLYGSIGASALAALVLTCDLSADPLLTAFAAVSGSFLVRALTADGRGGFGDACAPLGAAFAVLAVGCYFDASLYLLTAAALVLTVVGAAVRFTETGRGYLAGQLATALLTTVVVTVAVELPGAILSGMAFPDLLISPEFYRSLAGEIGDQLAWFSPRLWPALFSRLYDWPLAICGAAALIAAAAGLFRRRDYRGIVLALWAAAAVLMLIFFCGDLVPFVSAACLGYVWQGLCRRGRSGLADLGAAALLALLLGVHLAAILYVY